MLLAGKYEFKKIADGICEIEPTGDMKVPGRIYADGKLLEMLKEDQSAQQVVNVACLPGIQKFSLAMPDIHWGYGFPIGGVAAFDSDSGIISPGGVGYDINCGVRYIRTNLFIDEIREKLKDLVRELFNTVPSGVGSHGAISKLSVEDQKKILTIGAKWAIEKGYGRPEDLEYTEDYGCMQGADPSCVSNEAIRRGLEQIGTLGSGNHFLEIDYVDEIYDENIASLLGVQKGTVGILIHSGSRGFGYQICDDYLKILLKASQKFGISLPDRQLACAPFSSQEGKDYFSAMSCAANYAWTNRQVIMALAEKSLLKSLDISPQSLGFKLVYDVSHNIAKLEEHSIDGKMKKVVVHRKGATRALPANHILLPKSYKDIGQPVLVPGDMGRCSFICIGLKDSLEQTFASTCHGAGRIASRAQMIKQSKGRNLFRELSDRGITVFAKSKESVAEEMPEAYKDVESVVDVMEMTKISKKIVRLKPVGVTKG